MSQALKLAQQGFYHTSPNPRVGCVLVKDDEVIGSGYHQQAGEGHAEVNAIANANAKGSNASGATAYVTLEPCSHKGKTPPCANALIEAGIARVVIGHIDPNPEVSGKGIELLKNAGIEVEASILEQEAKALNPGFIKRMQTGLPWVFTKLASSLDGRTAMQSGESAWITGDAARADVQKLRARSCAVITGIGTVLQDNPQLSVRDEALAYKGEIRQPLRVVVDSSLQIRAGFTILEAQSSSLVVYAQAEKAKIEALLASGVELLQCDNGQGKVDLNAMLKALGERGCNEVMLEAGAKLNGAFMQEGLLDEIVLYMAATLLGDNARGQFALPFVAMDEQIRLELIDMRKVGDDLKLRLQPKEGAV